MANQLTGKYRPIPSHWGHALYTRLSLGKRTLTLALAGCFVPQHVDLVDPPELLEHLLQLLLVHRPGHLADEHLDIVRIGLVPDHLLVTGLVVHVKVHVLVARGRRTVRAGGRPRRHRRRRVVVYHLRIVVVQRVIVIVVASGAAEVQAGDDDVRIDAAGVGAAVAHVQHGTVREKKEQKARQSVTLYVCLL